jgi:hypothetical protein
MIRSGCEKYDRERLYHYRLRRSRVESDKSTPDSAIDLA